MSEGIENLKRIGKKVYLFETCEVRNSSIRVKTIRR